MTIINIFDLEPGDQFMLFISPSMGLEKTVNEIVEFRDEYGETIPYARRVAQFWSNEGVWKPCGSQYSRAENWNPSCRVVKVKYSDGDVTFL